MLSTFVAVLTSIKLINIKNDVTTNINYYKL